MQNTIKKVVIVGGTHGNETSGTTMIRPELATKLADQYSALSIQFMKGNPLAIEQNTRFTEEDLNRQFSQEDLQEISGSYEAERAKELDKLIGPKTEPKTDLVIDIHNTTSNMGPTLIILASDDFNVGLARYVKSKMRNAVILVEDEKSRLEHFYLCSLGKFGVMVEVGPQPQGVCRADILKQAYDMTTHILDYSGLWNNGEIDIAAMPEATAYRFGKEIHYPQNDHGKPDAIVHPRLQDKDFTLINKGDPIFLHFDGSAGLWQEEATYPHFINEAAYQHLQVAFATADEVKL